MALNFPTSPVNGTTYLVGTRYYLYNGDGFVPTSDYNVAPTLVTTILDTDRIYGYRNGIGKIEVDYLTIKNDIIASL